MPFYRIVGHNSGTKSIKFSVTSTHGQSHEAKKSKLFFLRITPFKIVVENSEKNVAYSIL